MLWVILGLVGSFLAVVCMVNKEEEALDEAETAVEVVAAGSKATGWSIIGLVILAVVAAILLPALLPPGSY